MEEKEHSRDNNRYLIALVVLVMIAGVIGVTFAYFQSQQTFTNVFQTKPYSTEFTEDFVSPDNWLPGTTTPKTVTAKNTGQVDVAVRVSYTESWTSNNGATLSGTIGEAKAAIINLANQSDWTYSNGFYYYTSILGQGESTNSFIESVTFNPDVEADYTCTENNGVKTCTSSGNGYDGATYTLTIKVETIQADAYKTAWSTDVTIS